MKNDTKIAFVGPGVMAEAMIAGLISQNVVSSGSITVSGPSAARVDELGERHAINTSTENPPAVAGTVFETVDPERPCGHPAGGIRGPPFKRRESI